MPSASSLRRASSKAHVCILEDNQYLCFQNNTSQYGTVAHKKGKAFHGELDVGMNVRGIRLENVCNTSSEQTADKSVVPNIFPSFLHVFLTWLNSEKPSGWGVIVITVVSGAERASGREALSVLRSAENAASTEGLRQRASRHCDYCKVIWQCFSENRLIVGRRR